MTGHQCLHLLWLKKWKKRKDVTTSKSAKVGPHQVECVDFRTTWKRLSSSLISRADQTGFELTKLKKKKKSKPVSHFWFFEAICRELPILARRPCQSNIRSDSISCELMNCFTHKFPIISTYIWSLESSCFLLTKISILLSLEIRCSMQQTKSQRFRRYANNVKG